VKNQARPSGGDSPPLGADYLSDEEYSKLQNALIEDPEAGDLIPGSGGVRKLRWESPVVASAVVFE